MNEGDWTIAFILAPVAVLGVICILIGLADTYQEAKRGLFKSRRDE